MHQCLVQWYSNLPVMILQSWWWMMTMMIMIMMKMMINHWWWQTLAVMMRKVWMVFMIWIMIIVMGHCHQFDSHYDWDDDDYEHDEYDSTVLRWWWLRWWWIIDDDDDDHMTLWLSICHVHVHIIQVHWCRPISASVWAPGHTAAIALCRVWVLWEWLASQCSSHQ